LSVSEPGTLQGAQVFVKPFAGRLKVVAGGLGGWLEGVAVALLVLLLCELLSQVQFLT
jgi:hypothetical protein